MFLFILRGAVGNGCGSMQARKPPLVPHVPLTPGSLFLLELLGEFCPLVERLGFDENFADITEIVEKRLTQQQHSGCSRVCVSGYVYNHQGEPEHSACRKDPECCFQSEGVLCYRHRNRLKQPREPLGPSSNLTKQRGDG